MVASLPVYWTCFFCFTCIWVGVGRIWTSVCLFVWCLLLNLKAWKWNIKKKSRRNLKLHLARLECSLFSYLLVFRLGATWSTYMKCKKASWTGPWKYCIDVHLYSLSNVDSPVPLDVFVRHCPHHHKKGSLCWMRCKLHTRGELSFLVCGTLKYHTRGNTRVRPGFLC